MSISAVNGDSCARQGIGARVANHAAMNADTGPVAVAMSGGADSTAAALILRDAGHAVIGLTGLLAPHAGAQEAAARAAAICGQLGIPHHVADLREAFERLVISPFVEEYARGRTPNPCVGCNERVKFGLLLEEADKLGAGRLATGHYARLERHGEAVCLLRAGYRRKDQSYVLHHLRPEQLGRAVFPHGNRARAEVESLVAALRLDQAPLAQSQDICFLRDMRYADLVAARAPQACVPGDIVDTGGRVAGRHHGTAAYTVGTRKGLGIGGPGGRKFVLHIDTTSNRLIVGDDAELWVSWCRVEDVNLLPCPREAGFPWHHPPPGEGDFECEVMLRYNGPLTPARVRFGEGGADVQFTQPVRAPTPGQSAVFYRADVCLGGGVIARTELTDRFGGA